ncbi:hypothetical protein DSL72_003083 [Monilinia vaccinii-corymbosi]|uniref:Uncharacterized protein n=1 Tax=Monilinia vaccinii-corymbosi TaxID=61207 RepID=A0A8A3NSA4_9HELO|nr:hypothetical protein DSL72_003083 [Monilinia vaccinii-corymbosi]
MGFASARLDQAATNPSILTNTLFGLLGNGAAVTGSGTIGDPTAAGNTCDAENDSPGSAVSGVNPTNFISPAANTPSSSHPNSGGCAVAMTRTITAVAEVATGSSSVASLTSLTGTLGGAPPPVISSAGHRPFSVHGDAFVGAGAALQRSCSVQHNACANAGNGGSLTGGEAQCETQEKACIAAAAAAFAHGAVVKKLRRESMVMM